MPNARTILDTRSDFDAGLCGYDHACDPRDDGEGLIIEAQPAGLQVLPSVKLIGPEGEVELNGRSEIEQAIKCLKWALDPAAAARKAAA